MISGSPTSTVVRYTARLSQHWLPALLVFTTLSSLGLLAAFMQKPVYEAEGKLVLSRTTPTSTLSEVGKEAGRLDPLSNLGNPALTQGEIIQSTPVLQDTLTKLGWQTAQGTPISIPDFKRKLTVSAVNATDIIKVSFKDLEADKAAAAVNGVMQAYLNVKLRSNQEDIDRTRKSIEKQLPRAEKEVMAAETEFRQFKQENQLLDLDSKVASTESRLNDLQRQITDAQAQLANTDAQMAATSQKIGMTPERAVSAAALSQSTEIQNTIREIQSVQTQILRERERFTANHPTTIQLENNLAELKQSLRQQSAKILNTQPNDAAIPDASVLGGALQQDLSSTLVRLDSTRQGLVQQIADLSQTLASTRQQSVRLPRLVQRQKDLERRLLVAQDNYTNLQKKLKETQIAENPTQGNAKVVSWAVKPEKPAGLPKAVVVLAGLFLGAVGGTATAIFLESLNHRIRTVEDAEAIFGLKILGLIPMSERSRNLLFYDGGQAYHIPEVAVRDKPGSRTCEAYRLLQSNLKILSSHRRYKVLIVSSSIPQEGTSTVCANLAAAIAQSGRKVLLIDANLHSPVQDEIWYIPHLEGLSNILAEEVSFWAAVSTVATNLDVLPAGNATTSSALLLDSPQMELLLDHCASLYDVVLLDTPALTASADATLLSHWADGCMVVVRPDYLDLENAIATQQILEQWGDKRLGMVMNGVPLAQAAYSYDDPTIEDTLNAADPVLPSGVKGQQRLSGKTPPKNSPESTAPLSRQGMGQADLDKMSAAELRTFVEALSQDWLKSTRLIEEQEAELDLQSQTVSELQERLSAAGAYHRHAANEYDRLSLEIQLADGEERKRLLDQTLTGQRRRLREQHELLRKALNAMRENSAMVNRIDPHPLFDPFSEESSRP